MRTSAAIAAALCVVLGASSIACLAQPASDVRARSLAATCANCHGTGGASAGVMPGLAGMPRAQIVRAMQEFRSGARQATIMHQIAKGYTDQQIDAIAGWFAAQSQP